MRRFLTLAALAAMFTFVPVASAQVIGEGGGLPQCSSANIGSIFWANDGPYVCSWTDGQYFHWIKA